MRRCSDALRRDMTNFATMAVLPPLQAQAFFREPGDLYGCHNKVYLPFFADLREKALIFNFVLVSSVHRISHVMLMQAPH